ncbi:MAG: ABC transporter ATP-binding protein [Sumerlaeia bacterium]
MSVTISEKPFVRISNLHKHYGKGDSRVEILHGVDLEIMKGEFVSLMGSSGSGKTTLLNIIGGLDSANTGSVEIEGNCLQGKSDDERSAFRLKHVGFVFQSFNLIPNLTVLENITVPLLFLGSSQTNAREKALKILNEVGLTEKSSRRINQLSGGERQRVGLARALVHEPKLVLADEPTGNLDTKTGHQILQLLQQLNKRLSLTIIMATHDHKAAEYASRTISVTDGQIIGNST